MTVCNNRPRACNVDFYSPPPITHREKKLFWRTKFLFVVVTVTSNVPTTLVDWMYYRMRNAFSPLHRVVKIEVEVPNHPPSRETGRTFFVVCIQY